MSKINVHCFLVVKFVFYAINQPLALKRLRSLEILVICVKKNIHTPPPFWGLAVKIKRYAVPRNFFFSTPQLKMHLCLTVVCISSGFAFVCF